MSRLWFGLGSWSARDFGSDIRRRVEDLDVTPQATVGMRVRVRVSFRLQIG